MQKVKSLEGLRGLAALSVVFFHLFTIYYPALVNGTPNQVLTYNGAELFVAKTPLNILYNGNFAVYVFFILSGYVLTYKFFRTGDNNVISAGAFKRYFRLVLPVSFSVICFYVMYQLNIPEAPKQQIVGFGLWNALQEAFFGVFFRHHAFYNQVLWTMTFEMFGSLIVFSFCLLFGKSTNRAWGYVLFIAIFWRSEYLSFILGTLLSDITGHKENFIHSRIIKVIILVAGIFIGSYPGTIGVVPGAISLKDTMYGFLYFQGPASTIYHTLGAFLTITVLLNSKSLTSLFSARPFQFLGYISFSLYVIHPVVVAFYTHFCYKYLTDHTAWSHKYKFIVMSGTSLIIIFALSLVMTKYLDRNGVKIANFMYNRFFKESETTNILRKSA